MGFFGVDCCFCTDQYAASHKTLIKRCMCGKRHVDPAVARYLLQYPMRPADRALNTPHSAKVRIQYHPSFCERRVNRQFVPCITSISHQEIIFRSAYINMYRSRGATRSRCIQGSQTSALVLQASILGSCFSGGNLSCRGILMETEEMYLKYDTRVIVPRRLWRVV